MRVIHLPAIERTIPLSQYVHAWKVAKANPEKTFQYGLTCWWSCTGKEIVEQFREGMMDRINQAIPYSDRQ